MAAGELSAQVRRNPPGRVEEGAWSPPWEGLEGMWTHRSLEQAGGNNCLVHRLTSVLGLRKEISEVHLGGGVHTVLRKVITKQLPGDC